MCSAKNINISPMHVPVCRWHVLYLLACAERGHAAQFFGANKVVVFYIIFVKLYDDTLPLHACHVGCKCRRYWHAPSGAILPNFSIVSNKMCFFMVFVRYYNDALHPHACHMVACVIAIGMRLAGPPRPIFHL